MESSEASQLIFYIDSMVRAECDEYDRRNVMCPAGDVTIIRILQSTISTITVTTGGGIVGV